MSRIRVLFVVHQFHPGGAERYLYEVARAIDKARFEVAILTREDAAPDEHFYPLLRAEGIPIHALLRYRPAESGLGGLRGWPLLRRRSAVGVFLPAPGTPLLTGWRADGGLSPREFFARFDIISVIGLDQYLLIQPLLQASDPVVLHVLSLASQYDDDPYGALLRDRRYRLVLAAEAQREDVTAAAVPVEDLFMLPLALRLEGRAARFRVADDRTSARIGVFTRLSREKPIQPLFYCLRELTRTTPATLHVCGGGDPRQLQRELSLSHVEALVSFHGHVTDLAEAVQNERLSLVWHMSYDDAIQYAGVELASFGIPMVFWNLYRQSRSVVAERTGGAVQAFQSVGEFVNFSRQLLADPAALASLGARLRTYVFQHADIRTRIRELEDYFAKVAQVARSRPGGNGRASCRS